MNDIDKMVVEDGVIKVKEPEKIIPATEEVINPKGLVARKRYLEAHIAELQQGVDKQNEQIQKSIDNDLAQIANMQADVDKIAVLLKSVPSDENVPVDGANGVG